MAPRPPLVPVPPCSCEQEQADALKIQVDQLTGASTDVLNNTRALEAKLSEARSKKETLKARAASAKTSQQIQEMMSGLNTSNAFVAFEKMEQKVLSMEAQAESTKMLVGSDTIDNRFKALETGTGALDGSLPWERRL